MAVRQDKELYDRWAVHPFLSVSLCGGRAGFTENLRNRFVLPIIDLSKTLNVILKIALANRKYCGIATYCSNIDFL